MKKVADDKTILDVEAWADVIEHAMFMLSPDIKLHVLSILAERINTPGPMFETAQEIIDKTNWTTLDRAQKLRALVIQIFYRRVTNNMSPEDGGKLLFGIQRYGTGSCSLLEYIHNNVRQESPLRDWKKFKVNFYT